MTPGPGNGAAASSYAVGASGASDVLLTDAVTRTRTTPGSAESAAAPQQEDGQEMGPYRPLEDAAESEDPDGAPEPSDIPPRDLGHLIAESVSTYAKAFLPLFAIALIPQIPNILGAALGSGDSFDDGASVSFNSGDLLLPLIAFLLESIGTPPGNTGKPGSRSSRTQGRAQRPWVFGRTPQGCQLTPAPSSLSSNRHKKVQFSWAVDLDASGVE